MAKYLILLLRSSQVNRLLQNQAEVIEAERTALVAEQHKELEKLIAAISASVNRDLPLRMEEMIRREVAGLGGSIAGTLAASLRSLVGPACQSALAEALPRDLAGPQLQVRFPLSSLIQVFLYTALRRQGSCAGSS